MPSSLRFRDARAREGSRTQRRRSLRLGATAALGLVVLALLPVAPVRAGVVITVTVSDSVNAPDGHCSLREAITAANANAPVYAGAGECPGGSGTDTIRLPAGYVTVDGQLPEIASSMTIDGGGHAIVDGTGGLGIFRVTGGTVLIERMTITGAAATAVSKAGGTLTLSDVNVNGITGDVAIANTAGAITIKGSTIASNTSPGITGGGLFNSATATILDSTINGNESVLGGGVYNTGTLTVRRTVLSVNSARLGLFDYGGGALVNHGTATITASTFTENQSDHPGGAIANDGTLAMANVTLTSNIAGGGSDGGAIFNQGGLTIVNGTLTQNAAALDGGGIRGIPGFTIVLKNTIVAGNTAGGLGDEMFGVVLGSGSARNRIGPIAGLATFLDAAGAQDNGGPTPTVQIYARSGSPFIDAGSATACASTLVGSKDQRGVPRPAACDIGAVEHERSHPTMTSAPTAGLRGGATLSGSSMPGRVTFAAKDNAGGSGVERYVLSRSVNGGAWNTLASGIPSGSWNVDLANGATYRFRVRAVDYDGNASAWVYGSTFTARLVQETSTSLTFSTGWGTRIDSQDSGGRDRFATTSGRSVKITFTGRAIALVSLRTTASTPVKVYVDGSYVGTASTAGGEAYRALTWTRRWSTSASHTIRLVVASSLAANVSVDAFAILK